MHRAELPDSRAGNACNGACAEDVEALANGKRHYGVYGLKLLEVLDDSQLPVTMRG